LEELLKAFSDLIDKSMSMQMATRYTPKIDFLHYTRILEKAEKKLKEDE
jgi:hypothetical protein